MTLEKQLSHQLQLCEQKLADNIHPLIASAIETLLTYDLDLLQELSIRRVQDTYRLNIVYPPLEQMPDADVNKLHLPLPNPDQDHAIYIHVPFCADPCTYCPYYRLVHPKPEQIDHYLTAIGKELSLSPHLKAASLYIGGGTPSYLSAEQLSRLMQTVFDHLDLSRSQEFTVEVHPNDVTPELVHLLLEAGVTRVSMGVQSMNDQILQATNRRHTQQQAIEAYQLLKLGNITSVNLDLMYGLPDQIPSDWVKTLEAIYTLQPDSVTTYHLRIHPHTSMYRQRQGRPDLFPSDLDNLVMHLMGIQFWSAHGYNQHPVDWFIKNPRHSHSYQDQNWRQADITPLVGIGPSAYSYYHQTQCQNHTLSQYLTKLGQQDRPIRRGQVLTPAESRIRTLYLGLKLGIDRNFFFQTFSIDPLEIQPQIWQQLEKLQLVLISAESITLTPKGQLFADEIGQMFLPAN